MTPEEKTAGRTRRWPWCQAIRSSRTLPECCRSVTPETAAQNVRRRIDLALMMQSAWHSMFRVSDRHDADTVAGLVYVQYLAEPPGKSELTRISTALAELPSKMPPSTSTRPGKSLIVIIVVFDLNQEQRPAGAVNALRTPLCANGGATTCIQSRVGKWLAGYPSPND